MKTLSLLPHPRHILRRIYTCLLVFLLVSLSVPRTPAATAAPALPVHPELLALARQTPNSSVPVIIQMTRPDAEDRKAHV